MKNIPSKVGELYLYVTLGCTITFRFGFEVGKSGHKCDKHKHRKAMETSIKLKMHAESCRRDN